MRLFDRFREWARAMDDIEEPSWSEIRRLRERIQDMEMLLDALAKDNKKGVD